MRNLDTNFQSALLGARDGGITPRTFVYITAKDRATGAPRSIGFWTGDDDVDVTVEGGFSGLPEARTYYGTMNLDVGDIARVSDLTIQTVSIGMSQIAEAAQLLVRQYDIRLAKVEIHEIALDPISGIPVSPPEVAFLGEVDSAPLGTPAINEDGSVTIGAVSDAISMLERANPLKSSYEGQKRTRGDEWGKFSSTVGTWDIPWGQKGSTKVSK